jgi:glyoxylase I family protein
MLSVKGHHMSFPVTDLDRAVEFYEGVLGLERIERPDFGGIRGVWYQAGGVQVHLIEALEGMELAPRPAQINPLDRHGAFSIDDYAEALSFLQAKGVAVMETTPENGQLFLQDPDGNIIELIVSG